MKEQWWNREDLKYDSKGRLLLAGEDLTKKAYQAGTPSFFYSTERVQKNLERLNGVLGRNLSSHQVLYAMKANRFLPLMTFMKSTGLCGVDVCSPAELERALSCGFEAREISYTGTSLSNADLDIILRHETLNLNCDGLSMIRRVGERTPGREIGIRINPAMGTGYGSNELLRYSGDKPSKFGIYASEFSEALKLAAEYDLKIVRIHFHTGCGYLNEQLEIWEEILKTCKKFLDKLDLVKTVNLGGGLGIPLCEEDQALDLDRWAGIIAGVFGKDTYTIQVEPGVYPVQDAGVLLLEVNTVERKSGRLFVGVNGGFNLAMEPAHYKLPCEPVPSILRKGGDSGTPEKIITTVAGNINEGLDLWIEDHPMTEIKEGDTLAFINAGAYASAMSSNHCMRGQFSEYLLLS